MIDITSVNYDSTIKELLSRKPRSHSIQLADGSVVNMTSRQLIFHMIFWEICKKWHLPITPKYIVNTAKVTSATISKLLTEIFRDIKAVHNNCHMVTNDIAVAMNKINNLTIEHCQAYHVSIDAVGLAKTASIPEIAAICNDKIVEPNMLTMKETEAKLRANNKALFVELAKPHPDNVIYPFISLRFVKAVQLAHIFYQIGYRSDIDDSIFRYVVSGNYLNGLNNHIEYTLEAVSAKKTAFYNQDSIPKSEYFGRRQHIITSNISKIYAGDCGTQLTVPLVVTERIKRGILYKYAYINDKLTVITEDMLDHLTDRLIRFRSPMTCRYTDGICEVCAGTLLSNITPNIHIGIFSAIQLTSTVTQFILSAKHMQETKAIDYAVPEELRTIMLKHKNGLYIKPKLVEKIKNLNLIIPIYIGKRLLDVPNMDISSPKSIPESTFGRVNDITFMRGDILLTNQVDMCVSEQYPMFSKSFITYIHNNPEVMEIKDDLIHISLTKFDTNKPVFKLKTINNSMTRFVSNVENTLERGISRYTSIPKAITDITDMLYEHIDTNLSYIEVVLKATMVTDKFNPQIPVVTDIDNVMFAKNKRINMTRSLGNLFAYQELPDALLSPMIFTIPKIYGKFDDFLNLK